MDFVKTSGQPILHAWAYKPTGLDPTKEKWEKITQICRDNQIFPFFDCAYQGFASGCLDTDVWAVQYFVSQRCWAVGRDTFVKPRQKLDK